MTMPVADAGVSKLLLLLKVLGGDRTEFLPLLVHRVR